MSDPLAASELTEEQVTELRDAQGTPQFHQVAAAIMPPPVIQEEQGGPDSEQRR